ncbi:MAG: leucyl aminopeptidase [Candidatus Zixiibacteriota bacterium]
MALRIEVTGNKPAEIAAKAPIAIFVNEKPAALPPWVRELDRPLADAIRARWEHTPFDGRQGKSAFVTAADGSSAFLIGLGKKSRMDPESIRRAYGSLIKAARTERVKHVAAALPAGGDAAATPEAATVGAILANYLFSTYQFDKTPLTPQVESLTLWEPAAARRRTVAKGVTTGIILAEATSRVRDLVNTPANDLTPENYAKIAAKWCDEAGVKLQVLGPREIIRAGMGAVMAVGGGSANTPRFLIATYLGRKRQAKVVDYALVGKGVTFDTGGISIKPSADMWEMRGDMMGSAVMLASICAAAKLKLPHNLIALAPLVENMPSGTAYRPGDVVKTLSGLTVEIISTDAEGRMILADALTYAQRFNPKLIIDCATLTGAIAVALGDVCGAVFTESDAHARAFERAAGETGEKVWRMPLYSEYDDKIKSVVADMMNSGGRYGGGPIAARFLKKFTGGFPWVHLDIAGVDLDKQGSTYCPKGASGYGARLMLEFLRK